MGTSVVGASVVGTSVVGSSVVEVSVAGQIMIHMQFVIITSFLKVCCHRDRDVKSN